MLFGWLMIIMVSGQYDSYYDGDGDLIPFEDLVPTQLVTTFEPPPQEPPQENSNANGESKFDFWEMKIIRK